MKNDTPKHEKRVQGLTITSTPTNELRRLRAETREFWSVRDLATQLGISRDYLKKMLRRNNPFPVRPHVATRLRELMNNPPPESNAAPKRRHRRVLIYTRYRVPYRVRLITKPRKCRGHRRWIIFGNPRQCYCSAECKKISKERERKHAKQNHSSRHRSRHRGRVHRR